MDTTGNTILQSKEEMSAFRETLATGEISKSEKSVENVCKVFNRRDSREKFYKFIIRLVELCSPLLLYLATVYIT